MNSYLIFVLILTSAYLIYFAVNIFRDLYGKPKGQKKDVEEFTFDNDSDDGCVEVSESEEGFNIGKEKYVIGYDRSEVDEEPQSDETAESRESKIAKAKAEAEAKLQDVQSFMSDAYTEQEMQRMIIEKGIVSGKADMQWKAAKNEI